MAQQTGHHPDCHCDLCTKMRLHDEESAEDADWVAKDRTIEDLRREVALLRQFGNKDCTSMADEAIAKARAYDKQKMKNDVNIALIDSAISRLDALKVCLDLGTQTIRDNSAHGGHTHGEHAYQMRCKLTSELKTIRDVFVAQQEGIKHAQ